MRLALAAVLFAAFAAPMLAEGGEERALVVTVQWDDKGEVAIEKVEKKEATIPTQLGFPQLWGRFFELRSKDKDGDVYFSGPLVDRQRLAHRGDGPPPTSATYTLIVPDLDEARHLVIVERISDDPDTGRKIVAERDL